MDRTYRQEPLLLSRFLLALVLFCTAAAAYFNQTSPACRSVRSGGSTAVIFLTQPPAQALYDSGARKLTIMLGRQLKSTASGPQDRAREAYEAMLAEAKDSAPAVPWRYLDIGKSWAGRSLWNEAKDWISQWHSNPRLLLLYIRYYWQAYRSGATDITPYEFAAFSLEMMKVAPLNLFAVNTAPKKPEERGQPAAEPPQAVLSSSPLRLEVLNASGHRGQAVAVTMYLRKLALQERLPVDVLSYDNYSRREKKSRMISRTGRIDELAALATRLGLSAMEITAAPARASQTDASFIVGEDLNLPSER